jgi:hypothetical protein
MTDDDKPTSQELTTSTRQSQAINGRSAPLKVTGKLRVAIEQMVWHGARRAEAAEKAGMKDHSLRAALRKGHVMAHYHTELGVLRESARARNFHRLDGIAEDSPNAMAKVAAIKVMEAISEPLASVASLGHAPAGYVIDLGPDLAGLTVRIVSPIPRRQGDDAIDVTPTPPREGCKDGR